MGVSTPSYPSFNISSDKFRAGSTTAYSKCSGFVKQIIENLPFKPWRCIKASFYTPENRLNFPTTNGFRMNIFMKLVYQYIVIFFIRYKPRIATAIRGL